MKQVFQPRGATPIVRDVPPPPCDPGGVLVANLFSVISSGTERTAVQSSSRSLVSTARGRPDLVKSVVERARRDGLRATVGTVRNTLAKERGTGYSSAGRVIEVGPRARDFQVGDLVACAGAGHASHAEIVSVPSNLCARVPAGVSARAAAMTTIAAIALHGIRIGDVVVGERVLVVGCGLVGQITCQLLAAAGAVTIGVDLDAERCEAARRAGADHVVVAGEGAADTVMRLVGGVGVDTALVTAASQTNVPLLLAADTLRDRGTLVIVGDVPVELPRAALFQKELLLRVSRSYGPGRYDTEYEERGLDYPIGYVRWTEQRNMQAVLELQAQGRLRLDELVSEEHPVERAADAYARVVGSPDSRPLGAVVLAYDAFAAAPSRAAGGTHADQDAPRAAAGVEVLPLRRRVGLGSAPLRIGLIGPGGFAQRVLAPAMAEAGARLQVVGGGHGPSAAAAGRQLGFARVAGSAADVISATDVDAIVIATRHGSHAELALTALRAGKHVFCEKPIGLTRPELDEVMALASASDRVFTVGYNRRFAPLFQRAQAFVQATGSPLTGCFRVSAGHIDGDFWVHDLEDGGGRALGEGCHFIDALCALVGHPVRSVYASGYGQPGSAVQARDNLVINLAFADGSTGAVVYVADGSRGVPKERLEVFSRSRTVVLDDFRVLDLYDDGRPENVRLRAQDKGHGAEAKAFVEAVRTGSLPISLEELANGGAATLAVVDSLTAGHVITLL